MMKHIFKLILLFSVIGFAHNAYCDTSSQEAINICSDKEEGDACDFLNNDGVSLNGFCRVHPDKKGSLVCMPSQ